MTLGTLTEQLQEKLITFVPRHYMMLTMKTIPRSPRQSYYFLGFGGPGLRIKKIHATGLGVQQLSHSLWECIVRM